MAVIVPSILSADFARLGEQVRAAAAGGFAPPPRVAPTASRSM